MTKEKLLEEAKEADRKAERLKAWPHLAAHWRREANWLRFLAEIQD